PSTLLTGSEWNRLAATFTAPADAVSLIPVAYMLPPATPEEEALPWVAGDVILYDAMMVTMGGEYAYFDGSFADDGSFSYAWTGTPNRSTSIREDNVVSPVDPLVDPDCAPIPSAPLPPVIDSDCIEEVGIWRRYWVTIPASEIASWQEMIPTVRLTTGLYPARQVRLRVYPNPFSYTPDQLGSAEWCSEQIIS